MRQVSFDKLLEPISKEKPCGEILEEGIELSILKEMPYGKEETQWAAYEPPDWRNIYRKAQGVLLKGKDLWAVIIYIYSLTELYKLEGVETGIEFLKKILELYWDNVQPELDPEDEDIAFARMSPLMTLAAPTEIFCQMILKMLLIKIDRVGVFSYQDLKVLVDPTAEREDRLEGVELENLAMAADAERMGELVASLKKIAGLCDEINNFITGKIGEENNTSNFDKLVNFFNEFANLLEVELLNCRDNEVENGGDEPDDDVENKELSVASKPQAKRKLINNRKDVAKVINELCKWLTENEPTNPAIYHFKKGQEVFSMDYWGTVSAMREMVDYISGNLGDKRVQAPVQNSAKATAESKEKNSSVSAGTKNGDPPPLKGESKLVIGKN